MYNMKDSVLWTMQVGNEKLFCGTKWSEFSRKQKIKLNKEEIGVIYLNYYQLP